MPFVSQQTAVSSWYLDPTHWLVACHDITQWFHLLNICAFFMNTLLYIHVVARGTLLSFWPQSSSTVAIKFSPLLIRTECRDVRVPSDTAELSPTVLTNMMLSSSRRITFMGRLILLPFCVSRSWVRSPLSPSTRRTVAMSTWAKTLWAARSSAPRARRWTSWYPTKTESLWVSFQERRCLKSDDILYFSH